MASSLSRGGGVGRAEDGAGVERRRRLFAVMGVTRRALHVVHRPGGRRGRDARDLGVGLGVHLWISATHNWLLLLLLLSPLISTLLFVGRRSFRVPTLDFVAFCALLWVSALVYRGNGVWVI